MAVVTSGLKAINASSMRYLRGLPARLGNWYHSYPKTRRFPDVKWKSLCAPACLPLTVETAPFNDIDPKENIIEKYAIPVLTNAPSRNAALFGIKELQQMIELRLKVGFQLVGDLDFLNLGQRNTNQSPLHLASVPRKALMSYGGLLHRIGTGGGKIVVEILGSPRFVVNRNAIKPCRPYRAAVWLRKCNNYCSRSIEFQGALEDMDWHRIDESISIGDETLFTSGRDTTSLWNSRYVLIPQQSHSMANEQPGDIPYNDEDKGEGAINTLKQMWQRGKHVSEDNHVCGKSKESTPEYSKSDIKEFVQFRSTDATRDEKSTSEDGQSQTEQGQLPFKCDTGPLDFDFANLAQAMQSEDGTKMNEHRRHFMLYKKCFTGAHLIDWLLRTFSALQSRKDATVLGTQLLKAGFLVYVGTVTHEFHDGDLLYRIDSHFEMPKNETRKSWFGKPSVSATPYSDLKESNDHPPLGYDGQQQVGLARSPQLGNPMKVEEQYCAPNEMMYNIDPRTRSNKAEVIGLHFDQSPLENQCYHILVQWMAATPKLIKDTVEVWRTSIERSGSRLIRLPITESSRLAESNPFTDSLTIKLAWLPQDVASREGRNLHALWVQSHGSDFHMRILQKHRFVLDISPSMAVLQNLRGIYYRSPQYVSQDGRILAQVNGTGEILLVTNPFTETVGQSRKGAHKDLQLHEGGQGQIDQEPEHGYSAVSAASKRATALQDSGVWMCENGLSKQSQWPAPVTELQEFCSNADALQQFSEAGRRKVDLAEG